ncbi:NACHT domain-containing protein [Actinomadura chibensis]|uniref:NACHT domain-containing protein n=1 Tax=Actinomadura chibensis TaxID=392828 RepID=A0A5D0NIG3_9ACTN|nr:NACHT domain-containing protein [Actinomadura chibensis]TYB44226.1 NACHT domain-containing protein [Actinomadura chibensis]
MDVPIGPLAAAAVKPLIGKLMPAPLPGAGLADPIGFKGRGVLSRGEARTVVARDVRKLTARMARVVTEEHPDLRLQDDGDAVVDAVTRTLMALGDITWDVLRDVYADPERLADALTEAADDPAGALSERGRRLYELMIGPCATQLVEYFTRNPDFTARTLLEIFRKLGELDERLPGGDRVALPFEERYRELLSRLHRNTRLFGLALPEEDAEYPLDTAYVQLSTRVRTGRGTRDADGGERPATAPGRPFESLLATSSRVLLIGSAGAGKSTLLKMLTLNLCRDRLPEQLQSWRDVVPFPLRLRRFLRNGHLDLPAPETFPEQAVRMLQGTTPRGWASELLRGGRAAVLLDGLDEVPSRCRRAVLDWLRELEEAFPAARFVVTSRPAGELDEEQRVLRRRGYVTTTLDPMTPLQVDRFIDRWYGSARVVSADADDRPDRAQALKGALFKRRDLSRLATNPLLCGVLCALNRVRSAELPRGRIALYRAALEMLLENLDRERGVPEDTVALSYVQSEAFLANMAMWMTHNFRRTIPERDALNLIEDLLPSVRVNFSDPAGQTGGQGAAALVLRRLVERSGVLQFDGDLMEFCHPSFQDYLAGIEVFRKNYVDELLRNADDPLFQDVLIMVVGQQQREDQRQKLILQGLVSRAEQHGGSAEARRLWLLAAACIADVDIVDPELSERIRGKTRGLLPPRNADEAAGLAAAGEFVLDLLAEAIDGRPPRGEQAAATVLAIRLVGGPQTLGMLKRFREHHSDTVRAEVVRAWYDSQTPEAFALEILAGMDLTGIPVVVQDPSYLPHLASVSRLTHLEVSCALTDAEELAPLRTLRVLDLSGTAVADLGPLAGLTRLEKLSLVDAPVVDVSPLAKLTKLRSLDLEGTRVRDVSPLARLNALRDLNIARTHVESTHKLKRLPRLLIRGRSGTSE